MATQVSLNSGAVASAGALAIQTNGTTQAVSISTGQVATLAQNPILTSGTINGVAYLNGSKVLTTGSALVFDGSSALGVGTSTPTSTYSARLASLAAAGTTALALDAPTGTNTSINFYYNGTAKWTTQVLTTGEYRWFDFVASSTRMTLDTSGNLGIGTSSPAYKLDISGASVDNPTGGAGSRAVLRIADTTAVAANNGGGILFRGVYTGTTQVDASGIQAYKANATDGNYSYGLAFSTRSNGSDITVNMRLDSSGNLLVGTADSSGTVGAGFKVLGGRPVTVNAASTDGTTIYEAYSTGAAAYRFYVGMGGTIFATSATITPIISDERLKQNIVDYSNGLSQVLGLRPRYFEYKKEPGRKLAGFISQEVQTVMPEAIVPTREDPEMMTYSIDWYPLFVKAIQEQQSLITQLTARITALEGA